MPAPQGLTPGWNLAFSSDATPRHSKAVPWGQARRGPTPKNPTHERLVVTRRVGVGRQPGARAGRGPRSRSRSVRPSAAAGGNVPGELLRIHTAAANEVRAPPPHVSEPHHVDSR